ncbi:MAG: SDR family oxidoreductase [Granulosicoccus sp.]|nr:SDR family oxidoreductase [Granulosicoccus sp.]
MSRPSCVLITGGSRGIGRACCDLLAEQTIPVVSLSRSRPATLPDTETHVPVDLSDIESVSQTMKQLLKDHPVSALICNAGRGDIGSLENFSAEQIAASLTLNLTSPLTIARHCIPAFRTLPRSDIIFIGSTSSLEGARYASLYSAAKFGLRGVAQALSHELSNANCHVGIVNPGMVRTSFFDTLDFEPGPEESHALIPAQVAKTVVDLLRSPDHAVISEVIIKPLQHVVRKRQSTGRS